MAVLKRFKKAYIYLFSVLIIFAVVAICNTSSAFAQSKQQARETIQSAYEETLDTAETYNGLSVLHAIKEKAFSDLEEKDDYDAVANSAVEKMTLLKDVASEYENLVSYVQSLNKDKYTDINWGKIQSYLKKALSTDASGLDFEKLEADGNLNLSFVQEKCAKAKENIDAVDVKQAQAGLTEQDRINAKEAMRNKFEECVQSGIYSQDVLDEMNEGLLSAEEDVDSAITTNQIESVKSDYISSLSAYKNVIETTYENFIAHEAYPEDNEPVSIDEIVNAINVYNSMDEKYKTDEITSYAGRLTSFYAEQKLKELEFDSDRYSPKYLSQMNKIVEDATADCKTYYTTVQVDERVEKAKGDQASVKTKVSSISSKDGKYQVTVTADKDFAFSPDAFVSAGDYNFYAVRKNLNRILRKIDTGDKQVRNGVKYYVNIKIIDEDGKEIKDFDGTVNYTVQLKGDIITEKLAKDELLKVVYYYSGKLEGYNSEDKTLEDLFHAQITGDTLMFTTTHFSPFAICGTTSFKDAFGFGEGPLWKNPLLYVAIILVLIILILLIMLMVKTWKYKITFYSNGGSKVKAVKARKGEPFAMPEPPTCNGYVFCGWFMEKSCQHRFISYRITRRKNIKVYAKWLPVNAPEQISEEKTSVGIDDLYTAIRTALGDYVRVGFNIGLKEKEDIARVIININEIFVYLNADAEKYKAMGYTLYRATLDELKDTPVKLIVKNEQDLYKALEIIDMVMADNGYYPKDGEPEEVPLSEEEREDGFVLSVTYDKVAKDLKDYFELIRTESKSYVLVGDSGTPRDLDGKYIVKAKLKDYEVDLYLPYNDGTAEDVSDKPLYKDVGAKYVIKDEESLKHALVVIRTSMEQNGLVKYPRNASLMKSSDFEQTAFGYKLKFN